MALGIAFTFAALALFAAEDPAFSAFIFLIGDFSVALALTTRMSQRTLVAVNVAALSAMVLECLQCLEFLAVDVEALLSTVDAVG